MHFAHMKQSTHRKHHTSAGALSSNGNDSIMVRKPTTNGSGVSMFIMSMSVAALKIDKTYMNHMTETRHNSKS